MADLYICPDVHARTFYKPLLDIKDTHIVFLGDYVDPYPQEAIFKEEAIPCLEEIIEFKKKNPKYVHLLLGNHKSLKKYFVLLTRNRQVKQG